MEEEDVDDGGVESDHFVARISPFWMLDDQLQGLFDVVELARAAAMANPHLRRDTFRRAIEVGIVGAIGFFEAFCKHQFAALLNVRPRLIEHFSSRRPEASLRLSALAAASGQLDASIGFVLAEQYDFGSARLINGLFRDLIAVTPFSKEEGDRFDAVLRKRHLIVHHAGVHTLASAQRNGETTIAPKPFRDAVELGQDEYGEVDEFLRLAGVKVAVSTVDGLKRVTNDLTDLTPAGRRSVERMLRGVWDDLS